MDEICTAEAFDALMSARWSCRAFTPEPVPRPVIEAILTTAQKTASWNNVQPWHSIVTSGAGTESLRRMLLARAGGDAAATPHFPFPTAYEGIYRDRRRTCGFQLYDAVGIAKGDTAAYARQSLRNFALFDAPHAAIVTSEAALGVYGAVDCGAFVTAFMLAARSHGVASIAQGALAVHAEALHSHFDLPQSRRVVCGIAFGWPDLSDPVNGYRTDRAALDAAVQWVET